MLLVNTSIINSAMIVLTLKTRVFGRWRRKFDNDYSVNIPMIFYYEKRMRHGWINIINPFRATLVLGTPGSRKVIWNNRPFHSPT